MLNLVTAVVVETGFSAARVARVSVLVEMGESLGFGSVRR